MRALKTVLFGLWLVALVALGSGIALVTGAGSDENERGVLATLISKALSGPGMTVSIGAVDGALSSDATIRDVVIADAMGPWLKLDRARIVWTRSALLTGRLLVDRLEIGRLDVLRRPLPAAKSTADGPLLPELPVKVEIGAFKLADLALGAEVAGVPAHLSAEGRAKLGKPSEGLDARFDIRRTDAAGAIDLALAFVPQTQALRFRVAAEEPPGGLVARLAQLPDLPGVHLDLSGTGTLDALNANLALAAGPQLTAAGTATLMRSGAARHLRMDAQGRFGGLLPADWAPVLGGDMRLDGTVLLADDGGITVEDLSLTGAGTRFAAKGSLSAQQALAGQVSLRSSEPAGVKLPGAQIGRLDLTADLGGTLTAPDVSARLLLRDADVPLGRLGRVDAVVQAHPRAGDSAQRFDVAAEAQGEGLAFRDPRFAALGPQVKLAVHALTSRDGEAEVSLASLELPAASLTYSGKLGPQALAGRLALQVRDLTTFRALAGQDLSGALKLTADLSGAPARQQVDARIALAAQRLKTGLPALDGLTGGELDVHGTAGLRPKGGFAFQGFEARGRHLSLTAGGEATAETADVTAAVIVPDASRASPQLTGRGEVSLHLTGSMAHPQIDLTARLTDGSAMGRRIAALGATATVRDPLGALQAVARLDGGIAAAKASGTLSLSRAEAGRWQVKTQDLALGSARVVADVSVDQQGLATGTAKLDVPDLDQLSPFALQKLSGTLRADIGLSAAQGRQGASVEAHAARVRLPGASLGRADLQARVSDLFGAAAADGTLDLAQLLAAGESIGRLHVVAKPAGGGSDLALTTQLRGIAVEAGGRLVTGQGVSLALNRFTAVRGRQRVALAGPATVALASGRTVVRGLVLATAGGHLSVDGSLGADVDLRFAAKGVPLALADLVQPDLGLAGTLDAAATLSGPVAAPTGAWQMKLAHLQAKALRDAGAPPLEITASGHLAGGRTSLQAALGLGRAGQLAVTGEVPIDGSPRLDLGVKGQLDAALANTALAADGRTLTGRATLDLRASGDLRAPKLSGGATLAGGTFEDPLNGLKLTRIEARLRGAGEELTVEQASAVARNGGTLSAAGRIRVAPAAGFPAALHITAREAELVSNPIVTAVADLALDLSGPLAQRPRVTGRATIREMDVSLPQRMPFSNRPLAGAVHVNPSKAARKRLAMEKARAARQARGPAFDADLDLAVSAPARIYVRGRGMDAELGGDLRLTGTLGRPTAIGAFELRRGRLDVAGQRLDFTRGKVDFAGDVIPNLDFVASTTAADVTAQVNISGPASKPVFAFTSSPSLPQDEVISRLLFARASGSLSPVQALQLAQTVAELTGEGGPGALDKVRRSLGVDTLDVGVDANGKPTLGASRYLTRNTRVGVRTGSKPEDSAVTLGVDLTRRLKAQGEVGADGKASVGLGFEWEY